MRITRDNVREAIKAFERASKAVGLIGDEYIISATVGSARDGISWSLYKIIPGRNHVSSEADVPGVNLDGCYTANEAWTQITAATYALDAVIRARPIRRVRDRRDGKDGKTYPIVREDENVYWFVADYSDGGWDCIGKQFAEVIEE